MGPRLFSRGNAAGERASVHARGSSMGPRLFSRGNASASARRDGRGRDLQWGRDSSVAEILTRPGSQTYHTDSSMGPRLFSRGNAAVIVRRLAESLGLQWGRDSSVAEMHFIQVIRSFHNLLQWGRDSSVAEMRQFRPDRPAGRPSFNGAATLQSRKLGFWQSASRLTRTFNGAATLQSRK